MSISRKGGALSENHKEKIGKSVSGDKNGMFGKTHTNRVKEILSNLAKDKVGDKNPMFSKKHSEEAKKKISEKAKNRKYIRNSRGQIMEVALE